MASNDTTVKITLQMETADGPLTAATIAEHSGLGRSTVTKALKTMAAEGSVDKHAAERHGQPTTYTLPKRTQRADRLGSGELRGQVLDFLARNAEPHGLGPSLIAKQLGRSAGAVRNALDTLTEQRTVTKVNDKPRRYTAA